MKLRSFLPSSAVACMLALCAQAHETPAVPATAPAEIAAPGTPAAGREIDPAAADAVKAVDAFSNAIKAGRLEEAGRLLDPKVLILESGSSERDRATYLREHAIEDAVFLKSAQVQQRYRQAHAVGDVAWVCTESVIQTVHDNEPLRLLSTETMVLRRTAQGWRIVHIHWSSHKDRAS